MRTDAVLSGDGRYRYRLTRTWGTGPTMAWIMLNPSTADAEQDDPTIRRCMSFARREGCGGIEVVNLYAFRATSPKDLPMLRPEAMGPDNARYVADTIAAADWAVAAWGATGGMRRLSVTARDLRLLHYPLGCLGHTADGHPRHPLYVKGDTPFTAWKGYR